MKLIQVGGFLNRGINLNVDLFNGSNFRINWAKFDSLMMSDAFEYNCGVELDTPQRIEKCHFTEAPSFVLWTFENRG